MLRNSLFSVSIMGQTQAVTNPPNPIKNTEEQLLSYLKTQSGLTLIGCLVLVAIIQVSSNYSKKGKIATSYWGGMKEKAAAARKAKKQIAQVTRNNVALYIGTPNIVRKRLKKE